MCDERPAIDGGIDAQALCPLATMGTGGHRPHYVETQLFAWTSDRGELDLPQLAGRLACRVVDLRFLAFVPPSAAARAAAAEPFLTSALVVDAPAAHPSAGSGHRTGGHTATGDELFAIDVAMPEVADGDGNSSLAFVIPVQPGWAGSLASITLSGPGGSVTLDGDTDVPMRILLDPRTGEVRGILHDVPEADAAAALASQMGVDGLDVLFGRGVPDAAAWDR